VSLSYWSVCPCFLSIGLLTSRCSWCFRRQVVVLRLSNWQAVLISHYHFVGLHIFACLPRIRSAQLLNCWAFVLIVCLNLQCPIIILVNFCFDCVLEPSVSNYHSCELSSECCCCLQCSSELSQKNIQDFLLSVFKGFYSVKDLVNVTNSTWRWHTSFCIEKRNFLPETFVGNCAGLSCKVIDRTVLSWKVIDHAVLSWKVIDCVPCYVGR